MVRRTSFGFSNLVLAAERIENMIKIGKIQNSASTSDVVKKPFVAYGNKQEGETNEIIVFRERASTYHSPYQQVTSIEPMQNQHPFTTPVDQRVQQQPTSYQPPPQQQRYHHQQQQH